MEKVKLGFDDFIASVDSSNKKFVPELHRKFTAHDCKIVVKEAKSAMGYDFLLRG